MITKCAAILVDEVCRVEFPMYMIETDKESITQVYEDISRSTFTDDQKAAMLGYLRHEAAQELSEEEVASIFGEIEACDKPAMISVDKENYPLIYKSLEQVALMQECEKCQPEVEAPTEPKPEAEAETPTEEAETIPTTEAVPEVEVEDAALVEMEAKVEELQVKVDAQEARINALVAELATYKVDEREVKLQGIVEMLIDLQKPMAVKFANNKDEILSIIMTRTQESLDDLYEDLKAEKEDYVETEMVIPEVEDPTVGALEAAKVEETTEKLHDSITEDELDMEVYNVLVGKDAVARIVQVANTTK